MTLAIFGGAVKAAGNPPNLALDVLDVVEDLPDTQAEVVSRKCRLLPRCGDRKAGAVIGQVPLNRCGAVLRGSPDLDVPGRLEKRIQIPLVVRQQEGPDARRLEQAHVAGLFTGNVDVRVQRDAGPSQ